jgi:hypothetical protein
MFIFIPLIIMWALRAVVSRPHPPPTLIIFIPKDCKKSMTETHSSTLLVVPIDNVAIGLRQFPI